MEELEAFIQKIENKDINPFSTLGVDTWVLLSMNFKDLKSFLSDFKKIIAKYHHPDKFQNQSDKELHESYFKQVTSTIDKLLNNDFYFRKNLDELGSGSTFTKYEDEIKFGKKMLVNARDEIKELERQLIEKDDHAKNILKIFSNIKLAENYLVDNNEALVLHPDLECKFKVGNVMGNFRAQFNDYILKYEDPVEYEIKRRKLLSDYIQRHHWFTKKEKKAAQAADSRRLEALQNELDPDPNDLEIYAKTLALRNSSINGNMLTVISREGTNDEKHDVYEIYGCLTCVGLAAYIGFYESNKERITKFQFENMSSHQFNSRIHPFTSNIVSTNNYLFLKEEGKSDNEPLELFVPVEDTLEKL
ncbi:hypothetical protein ACFL1H_01995 [Nanoarchaeota archaeon]